MPLQNEIHIINFPIKYMYQCVAVVPILQYSGNAWFTCRLADTFAVACSPSPHSPTCYGPSKYFVSQSQSSTDLLAYLLYSTDMTAFRLKSSAIAVRTNANQCMATQCMTLLLYRRSNCLLRLLAIIGRISSERHPNNVHTLTNTHSLNLHTIIWTHKSHHPPCHPSP